MRSSTRRVLILTMALALFAAPAAASGADGFDGPLFGLDTADSGRLLIADASTGIIGMDGNQTATLVDLPGATAVSSVSGNTMWITRGAGESPQADSGQSLWLFDRGMLRYVSNLFEFEAADNPDGYDPPDSNPYDVAAIGKGAALVVDAGGNDLLRVSRHGDVDVLAVFPDTLASTANLKALAGCPTPPPELAFACGLPDQMPTQATPTSVAIGRDGAYYVGELRGFPGPAGESSIWRVSPDADGSPCPNPKCQKVFDGGFTSIIDLDFDRNGNLIVAELDEASWVAVEVLQAPTGGTVNRCDLGSGTCEELATDIPILTAVTVDRQGTITATRNALIPGLADVFEIN